MAKVFLDITKSWGLFVLVILQSNLCGGADNLPAGARSLALSHASVSSSDVWATFHNQAGLAEITHLSGGVFFESKFGIDELSLGAGALVLPAGNGAFAISTYQFGKGTFRESKYGLAYARQLSEKWSTGLQLDYFLRTFPENERATGFATFEGGLLFHPSGNLHLGAHVFNPVSGGYESPYGKQEMPLVIRLGGHYDFDKMVLVAFEAESDNLNPVVLKSGIEFIPAENFAIRIGISGKPVRYTAGFGYSTGRFSADFGFAYHGNLGITPSVSVQFGL